MFPYRRRFPTSPGVPRSVLLCILLGEAALGVPCVRAELHHGVAWYGPAPSEEVRRLAAERYEVGVAGLSSGEDRLAVKKLNPDFRWFAYMSGTDNYVPPHPGVTPEHEALLASLVQQGMDPEDGYLHYWDDTVIVIRGDTVLVPGWGEGRAVEPSAARVPVYNSELTRRAKSFATPVIRGIQKNLAIASRLDVPFPGTGLYADGIFLDNSSGILFNRGEVISGGRVREAPDRVSIDSDVFREWYFDSFVSFLAELQDTLAVSQAWSKDGRRKELMVNISNVWDEAYVDRKVADILLLEFLYNPIRRCGADAVQVAYERDRLAAEAGIASFYTATMTSSVPGQSAQFDYGEVLLGNLSWYLLSRSPSTIFYQQGTNAPNTAGWDTLTWRGVMDVADDQLGEAMGPPYALASGTDPVGNPYTIQGRHYQGGLVLLRNRGGWKEGIEPETAVEVDLPALLAPVSPSGSVSAVVDRVSLRNGEGAILLGDPGPPPGR